MRSFIIITMEIMSNLIMCRMFVGITPYYVYFFLLGSTEKPFSKGIVSRSSYPCKASISTHNVKEFSCNKGGIRRSPVYPQIRQNHVFPYPLIFQSCDVDMFYVRGID